MLFPAIPEMSRLEPPKTFPTDSRAPYKGRERNGKNGKIRLSIATPPDAPIGPRFISPVIAACVRSVWRFRVTHKAASGFLDGGFQRTQGRVARLRLGRNCSMLSARCPVRPHITR